MVVGIVAPFSTLPQIAKIFALHNAAGVSLITWSAYALFDLPWILYGMAHRSRPIVISYCLWAVTNLLVVGGALYYGTGLL